MGGDPQCGDIQEFELYEEYQTQLERASMLPVELEYPGVL